MHNLGCSKFAFDLAGIDYHHARMKKSGHKVLQILCSFHKLQIGLFLNSLCCLTLQVFWFLVKNLSFHDAHVPLHVYPLFSQIEDYRSWSLNSVFYQTFVLEKTSLYLFWCSTYESVPSQLFTSLALSNSRFLGSLMEVIWLPFIFLFTFTYEE